MRQQGGKSRDTVNTLMNAVFSVIFLADFIYRVVTAPSPGGYDFKHFGWADILASLPFEQCNPPCRWPACPRPGRPQAEIGMRNVPIALK